MPSGYLHKVCALKVCEAAGVSVAEPDIFILGAQGPDPLFMLGMFPLRLSSKPSKLAKRLHTSRTGAFLCALSKLAKERGPVERAFAMGFLTHYALDSTVHPYVYAQSYDKQGNYSSLLHMRLERQWDSLFYQRDGHRGTSVVMPGIAETKRHWAQVAGLWAEAIQIVYPQEDVSRDTIEKALADAGRVNRLTYSPHGVKYAAVWVLERVIGKPMLVTAQMAPRYPSRKDIMNEALRPWRNPSAPDQERNEGLALLFEAGVRRGVELLRAAHIYYDGEMTPEAFAEIVGNVGYGTGMTSDE